MILEIIIKIDAPFLLIIFFVLNSGLGFLVNECQRDCVLKVAFFVCEEFPKEIQKYAKKQPTLI